MSAPAVASIELRLKPSLGALQLVFLLHLLVIVMLPLALPPGAVMLSLLAGVAASWFWLRRHPVLGFGPRAITRLVWHGDGGWSLYRGEREIQASLLDRSLVHPRVLLLQFRTPEGQRLSRLIVGGEAEAEPLRRLHARLRQA